MKRVTILALLAIARVAGAQTPVPAPLRLALDDAIRRGLETSHRLAEAAARGDAAEALAEGRRAAMRPQIAVQAGFTRTNHVDIFGIPLPNNQLRVIYPDIPDNYRTRLDLQWPIYTSGRLDALERAARAEASASADDVAAARGDLRLEITRAYWALVTAGESLGVVEESLKRMDAHLQDMRNRLSAGLVPPNDVLSVQAQESRQRMLAVQARSTRDVAQAELAKLVGVDAGTSLEPTAPLELPAVPTRSVDELLRSAKAQRPERAALNKRTTAAEERWRMAAAGLRPTVAVGGGVDYARPNPRIFPRQEAWRESWDASINVNWPVFDGGRARAEMAEAAALSRAVDQRAADFDRTLAVEVRQRLSELQASRAAVDAASDAIRSATEARRVVGDRFSAGVATSTDVLDAQVALLQAALDRTQAVAAARLVEARLERALGR